MRIHTVMTTAAVAGTLVSCLVGCSGSGGGAPSSPPPGTPTTRTHGGSPSGSASGSPADAATRRAVQQAYSALFGTKATLAESLAALQHGSQFRQTILAQSKNPKAQHSGATVTAVSLLRPDLADVHFAVTENGQPIFPTVGKAVRVGGHWQVAAQTFCQLLRLDGGAPKACNDPAVTALPH